MWLFLPGFFHLKFIHVMACISTQFLFNCWIIFHCLDMPHFIIWWVFDLFWFLAVTNNATINIYLQVVWMHFHFFFYLRVELLDNMMKLKSLSRAWFFASPWLIAYQAPPSMGFSRQRYWSGLPFPSPHCFLKVWFDDLVKNVVPKASSQSYLIRISSGEARRCSF